MADTKLYTVVSTATDSTIEARLDPAGNRRAYPPAFALVEKREYCEEDFKRLTDFTSEYHYLSYDVHTEWIGSADPTPYTTEGAETKEPVLASDVVVKDGEVFGLLKKSPYREEYQIVTKDKFSGCHFSFSEPGKCDADNSYAWEYVIMKNK